jgi:rieske iron-sulfur protein
MQLENAMSVKNTDAESCPGDAIIERRTLLARSLALTFPVLCPRLARADATDPRMTRPQPGDRLVFTSGDRREQIIKPADLAVREPPTLAYPMDPSSRSIRDGSRANMILLLRLEPDEIAEADRGRVADGIVAFSAICTHFGCPVTGLDQTGKNLACKCHGSIFDPRNNAEVVGGPAPRRLAAISIKLEDGELSVAGEFSGAVGQQR